VVRLPVLFLGLLLLLLASPARADVVDGAALEGSALLPAADVPDEFVEEEVFDDRRRSPSRPTAACSSASSTA
jgi:hypothetical protein